MKALNLEEFRAVCKYIFESGMHTSEVHGIPFGVNDPEKVFRNFDEAFGGLIGIIKTNKDSSMEQAEWSIKARAAMQEFIDRVEKGDVKSVRTYNKFKELLSK